MTTYRLTSGYEDFGSGSTPEQAVEDAIANACHPQTGKAITREWVDEQMQRAKRESVMGAGLYIDTADEN